MFLLKITLKLKKEFTSAPIIGTKINLFEVFLKLK